MFWATNYPQDGGNEVSSKSGMKGVTAMLICHDTAQKESRTVSLNDKPHLAMSRFCWQHDELLNHRVKHRRSKMLLHKKWRTFHLWWRNYMKSHGLTRSLGIFGHVMLKPTVSIGACRLRLLYPKRKIPRIWWVREKSGDLFLQNSRNLVISGKSGYFLEIPRI